MNKVGLTIGVYWLQVSTKILVVAEPNQAVSRRDATDTLDIDNDGEAEVIIVDKVDK